MDIKACVTDAEALKHLVSLAQIALNSNLVQCDTATRIMLWGSVAWGEQLLKSSAPPIETPTPPSDTGDVKVTVTPPATT